MPPQSEIARLGKMSKTERREALRPLTAAVVKASRFPQLSGNGKDAIRVDALAQISSTIGLQDEQESVGLPTVTRINDSQSEYEVALDDLIQSTDLMEEKAFRDELLTISKIGVIRPLNFVRRGIKHGLVLLRNPKNGRLWA